MISKNRYKKYFILATGFFAVLMSLSFLPAQEQKKRKLPQKPFDIFPHEFHMPLFEAANVQCDLCHSDPDSFQHHEKINRMGCHHCHNNPNAPLPASNDCSRCHAGRHAGKPLSHRADWVNKHQSYAKADPDYCSQCHTNAMFCMNCHKRRDTVQTRMHTRNFKYFHSIQARANPRKCDACHTVDFCQRCHSGKADSGR